MRAAIYFFGLLGALLSLLGISNAAVAPRGQLHRRADITKIEWTYVTRTVTERETITSRRGAVTVTGKGTSTTTTTRRVGATNTVNQKDSGKTVTVTSTTTTTLPPITVTSAAQSKTLEKRQLGLDRIRTFIDDILDEDTTRTIKSVSTITRTVEQKVTQVINGPTETKFAKVVTVTVEVTTATARATNAPSAVETTTLWVTETATPEPVVVEGEEKKKEEGMTSGQKAGIGAAVGIIGALALAFGAFVMMKKKKRKQEMNEKEDFNRLGPEDAYDPSMRGTPDGSTGGLPVHPPPPQGNWSSTQSAGGFGAGAGAAVAGAGIAGAGVVAASNSRQQTSSPSEQVEYGTAQPIQYSSPTGSARTSDITAVGGFVPDHQRSISPPDQYQIQPPSASVSPLSYTEGDTTQPFDMTQPFHPYGPVIAAGAGSAGSRLSIHPDILTPGVPTPEQRRMSTIQPTGTPSPPIAVPAAAAAAPLAVLNRNSRSFTAPDLSNSSNSTVTQASLNTARSASSEALPAPRRISTYSPSYGAASWGMQQNANSDNNNSTGVKRKAVPKPQPSTDTLAPLQPPQAQRLAPPRQRTYAPYRPDSIIVTPATPAQNETQFKRNSAWEKAAEY